MDEKSYLNTVCDALRRKYQHHQKILNKYKNKRKKSIDVDDITYHQKGLEDSKTAIARTRDMLYKLR